jgi:hypothetical protein
MRRFLSQLILSLLIVLPGGAHNAGPTAGAKGFDDAGGQKGKAENDSQIRTYRFVHSETTGMTSFVVVNGKEWAIEFHRDSDPVAVKAFGALGGRVLLPNAYRKKIFLVGSLLPAVKVTRSCTGCAQPEEYREFKLVDWFITTPIKIVRADCDNCPYLREENLRSKSNLDLDDFGEFEGRANLDVRRFQRGINGSRRPR